MSNFDLNRREIVAGLLSVGGAMMIDPSPAFAENLPVASTEMPPPQEGTSSPSSLHTAEVILVVNGNEHTLKKLDVNTTLLDCLRDDLHLTGSKKGLRPWTLRCMHGTHRWASRNVLPHPCGHAARQEDHHD